MRLLIGTGSQGDVAHEPLVILDFERNTCNSFSHNDRPALGVKKFIILVDPSMVIITVWQI